MKISAKENRKILSEEECWNYYSALPFYPLGDMRDYMILLDFLFGLNLEEAYSKTLHRQVGKNQLELAQEMRERGGGYFFRREKYLFYYENKIMNLVSQGDTEVLKQGIAELGTSVLPLLTSNSLRTEKLYDHDPGKIIFSGDPGRKGYLIGDPASELLCAESRG